MEALSRLIFGLIQLPEKKRPRKPLFCRHGNGLVTGPGVIYAGALIVHAVLIVGVIFLVCTR